MLLISRKKTIHLCPNLFHYGQWLHNNATDCEFSCKLCYWKSFVVKGLSKSVNACRFVTTNLSFQKWKYIYSQWMSKEGIVYLLMILNVHRYANVVLERSLRTNEGHIGVNESILTVIKKSGHKWMDISWKWTAKGVLSCQ